MSEEWRPVVGSSGRYEVSNEGKVRSFALSQAPRLLVSHLGFQGYLQHGLRLGGRTVTVGVHQLVLAAFVGPLPPGHEVRHLDGVKTNNRLSNLVYGTRSENRMDSVAHGTHSNARKTHCPAGHPYDATNTRTQIWKGSPRRVCRACDAARVRAQRAQRKAVAASTSILPRRAAEPVPVAGGDFTS